MTSSKNVYMIDPADFLSFLNDNNFHLERNEDDYNSDTENLKTSYPRPPTPPPPTRKVKIIGPTKDTMPNVKKINKSGLPPEEKEDLIHFHSYGGQVIKDSVKFPGQKYIAHPTVQEWNNNLFSSRQ